MNTTLALSLAASWLIALCWIGTVNTRHGIEMRALQRKLAQSEAATVAAELKVKEEAARSHEIGTALNSNAASFEAEIEELKSALAEARSISGNWRSNYFAVKKQKPSAPVVVMAPAPVVNADTSAIAAELRGIKRAIWSQPDPTLTIPQSDWYGEYQRKQLIDGVNRTADALEQQARQQQFDSLLQLGR